jgi:hypothetical protein
MARVRNIAADELPADLAAVYRKFAGSYGPFANQVAVFAHVPAVLRHLMPVLMELRAAATLPKREAARAFPRGADRRTDTAHHALRKAGTHPSAALASDKWIPAFAGKRFMVQP